MPNHVWRENLVQCYRQLVQYFNEFHLSPTTFEILVAYQTLSVTLGLLVSIDHTPTVDVLQVLSLGNFLGVLGDEYQWLVPFITVAVVQVMLLPLYSMRHLLWSAWSAPAMGNGDYSSRCKQSYLQKISRAYLCTFEFVGLPTLTIYATFQQSLALAAFIVLMSVVSLTITDYHLLQLHGRKIDSHRLIKLNFPHKLLDSFFYCGTILVLYLMSGYEIVVVASICNAVRMLFMLFFSYYPHQQNRFMQLYLIINQFILLGLGIAHSSSAPNVIYVLVSVILAVIVFNRKVIMNIKLNFSLILRKQKKNQLVEEQEPLEEEPIQQEMSHKDRLKQLQSDLWSKGCFAKTFRELIFLGKQHQGYRQTLLVEILKAKCHQLQIGCRPSTAKKMDCETVICYQALMKDMMCLIVSLAERSLSLLRLMDKKDSYSYILREEVCIYADMVTELKQGITQLLEINEWSAESRELLMLMFSQFMQDTRFVQSFRSNDKYNSHRADRKLKLALFDQNAVMVFLNMLDEMGRIVRTSKNLPSVLGYNPHQLQGIEIDDLLIDSMRGHHLNRINHFVDSYCHRVALKPKTVNSYAFNNKLELQKVDINYNMVMSNYSMFQICGVIHKMPPPGQIVLVDRHGFIQGYSHGIGTELGMAEVKGSNLHSCNLFPLLPCLIKYAEEDQVTIKTIFFRPKNYDTASLKVNIKANEDEESTRQLGKWQFRVLEQFMEMVEEELMDGYLVDIELQNLHFFEGKVNIKQLVFKTIIPIRNYSTVLDILLKNLRLGLKAQSSIDRSVFDEPFSYENAIDGAQRLPLQTNFTLDPNARKLIKSKDLVLEHVLQEASYHEYLTESVAAEPYSSKEKHRRREAIEEKQFSPKIETNWYLYYFAILTAIAFLLMTIYTSVGMLLNEKNMNNFNNSVLRRNRALAIAAQSFTIQNSTYINQFENNNLLDEVEAVYNGKIDYLTIYNATLQFQNYYYEMVHLPALLQRSTFNDSVVSSTARSELSLNSQTIVRTAQVNMINSLVHWQDLMDRVRLDFIIEIIAMFVGIALLMLIFGLIFKMDHRRIDKYEAFFRFPKEEVDLKAETIREVVKVVERRASRWYLIKQLQAYIKEKDISNLVFTSLSSQYEPKIQFQVSQTQDESIKSKLTCRFIVGALIFLASQFLFAGVFISTSLVQIEHMENNPPQLDACSKLMIIPHLQTASISVAIPSEVVDEFIAVSEKCFEKDLPELPGLLSFLSSAPCANCTLLYPLLTNNFISFYSTFAAMTVQMQHNSSAYSVTQMVEASNIVTDGLYRQLTWFHYDPSLANIFLYLLSLIVLLVVIGLSAQETKRDIQSMETFMRMFRKDMIEKNKLIENLLSKEQ